MTGTLEVKVNVPLVSAPNLSTFHSFCVRLLRRDGDPLARHRPGFTRRFSIYGGPLCVWRLWFRRRDTNH